MEFESLLIKGILIKRYKRFLADITLDNGSQITAHTPNTGSMRGCSEPGSTVWLRDTKNPDRKYPLSWEMVEATSNSNTNVLVGINTLLSNSLVEEAIRNGVVTELQGYDQIRREVKYGEENSRIDLLLEHNEKPACYVEVKNVTLVEDNIAYFPDAVTKRGSKHLRELIAMVEQGHRAIIFYCIQRNDVREVQPADEIDPEYGQLLRTAINSGIEAIAYSAKISPVEIELVKSIPVICP
ncbi:MAG: DNA/RNA nuclease SfsA [Gammaproteobacteria bacterium]